MGRASLPRIGSESWLSEAQRKELEQRVAGPLWRHDGQLLSPPRRLWGLGMGVGPPRIGSKSVSEVPGVQKQELEQRVAGPVRLNA
jgi:hypothetical protein